MQSLCREVNVLINILPSNLSNFSDMKYRRASLATGCNDTGYYETSEYEKKICQSNRQHGPAATQIISVQIYNEGYNGTVS